MLKNGANDPIICTWEDERSGETEARCEARVLHQGSVCMTTVMEAGWS